MSEKKIKIFNFFKKKKKILKNIKNLLNYFKLNQFFYFQLIFFLKNYFFNLV